ncbi:hypothetical protein CAQU_02990 [Corynebacterium aquilae DSM 44791]|uniref:Integral membrane protein n=1 Tax=Corynebacterium aquilae DSM 44791 TaxID=1431546 RepID=A0A1L7CED3_9CORY|nr:hypothetical protein CAQU_02990 [Corynebacterium aquilae DSM 44791]
MPATIRRAGIIGMAEGAIGLIYAIYSVIHQITHGQDSSLATTQPGRDAIVGYGNAVFILLVFGFVGWCGWLLYHGKRFGRGPVVILQMLLLPVAYYMIQGGQPIAAVLTAIVAAYGLWCCFNNQALEWAREAFSPRA